MGYCEYPLIIIGGFELWVAVMLFALIILSSIALGFGYITKANALNELEYQYKNLRRMYDETEDKLTSAEIKLWKAEFEFNQYKDNHGESDKGKFAVGKPLPKEVVDRLC